MGAPSHQHFAAELAEIAGSVRDRAAFRRAVVSRLEAIVGCESVYWGEPMQTPTDTDRVCASTDETVRRALVLFARERRRFDVPRAIRAIRAEGGVAIGDEVFTRAEQDRLPVYREVVRPAGIRSYIFCEIDFRGRVLSTVTLSRHARGAPFGGREKGLVRSIKGALGLVEAAFGAISSLPRGATEVDVRQLCPALSAREAQVATLVARGLGNKSIAEVLGTAPDTVRKQTIRIYEKLRVAGRVELATLVASHGPKGVWRRAGPRA
jgi:DNA-binding CsgD family transcriptional regulator